MGVVSLQYRRKWKSPCSIQGKDLTFFKFNGGQTSFYCSNTTTKTNKYSFKTFICCNVHLERCAILLTSVTNRAYNFQHLMKSELEKFWSCAITPVFLHKTI